MSHLAARTQGSPPLARGTGKSPTVSPLYHGITPACAGNSGAWGYWRDCRWDHPRLRGEQLFCNEADEITLGSPPLARGTVFDILDSYPVLRITPACAGNSRLPEPCRRQSEDHPRLRGEQCVHGYKHHTKLGSPPLARGTVCREGKIQCRTGITPACAGNSCHD